MHETIYPVDKITKQFILVSLQEPDCKMSYHSTHLQIEQERAQLPTLSWSPDPTSPTMEEEIWLQWSFTRLDPKTEQF